MCKYIEVKAYSRGEKGDKSLGKTQRLVCLKCRELGRQLGKLGRMTSPNGGGPGLHHMEL